MPKNKDLIVKNGYSDEAVTEPQEIYIKDRDGGYHLVVIKRVELDENGRLKFEYTSSSDLDEYGLTQHLEVMVRKLYLEGGSDGVR